MSRKDLVVWFSQVGKEDVALVGGKGANLGEMTQAGFPVPNGFIVTANAYYQFIKDNNLAIKIDHLLKTTHFERSDSLMDVSNHIKKLILTSGISPDLVQEIYNAYKMLGGTFKNALVAVRSSATAEDLPNASFAGQQETYLNVHGEANVIIAIKKAWASLFEPRAIFYRHEQKFDHFKIGIAVPVQKMVNSESSGVMFSMDPLNNDKSTIIIEAILGLGEMIVQGKVTPDHYEIDKKDMKITKKNVQYQQQIMEKRNNVNKDSALSQTKGSKQKISDKHILDLAHLAVKLEKHYYFPQDMEWAIEKNNVYIVQTRPITTIKKINAANLVKKQETQIINQAILLTGDPASPGIASGPVKILKSAGEIGKVVPGDVLVTPQTNPDFVPAMKKAIAIITEMGGRTSHAAIVSRELGIPAIVGANRATTILKTGDVVTVNGSTGNIYKGGHAHSTVTSFAYNTHVKTATKVYVNLAEPELAEKIAKYNVDGVGLLRAEFMMAGIGTHPKKMIRDGKSKEYIRLLAEGMETFCKTFFPRPVIYRTSDFKTNEYRQLAGGRDFEPTEPNPMLGYRGAYRYINDPEVFELELEAIKLVRNKKGFKNLWIMIPFVRTVKELIEVKKLISASGLYRSNQFKIWMMVEIPSNVILLEKFINVGIDGVSVGSNDLTMLLLGTDRDNSEVAHEFDEQNEAVMWALEKIIKTCHLHKITASICGQAASLYPNMVQKLVELGITSVSVSPDAVEHTRELIAHIEKGLVSRPRV